jgi:hypothetical protein
VEGSFVGCGFGEKKENLSRDDILLVEQQSLGRIPKKVQIWRGGGEYGVVLALPGTVRRCAAVQSGREGRGILLSSAAGCKLPHDRIHIVRE